MKGEQNYSNL